MHSERDTYCERSTYLKYSLRFIVLSMFFLLSVLVGALFLEYRRFCDEARKLLVLQAQYRFYVRDIQKKSESGDGGTDFAHAARSEHWGVRGDDFIMVNRDPHYLRDSMIGYFKDCQLDGVLSRINMHEWQDYTGNIGVDNKPMTTAVARKPARVLRPIKRYKTGVKHKYGMSLSSQASFFVWPIESDQFWISSLYGPRKKANGTWGKHTGIDMAAIKGTKVMAVAAGTVLESRYVSGYGNTIVLRHNNRYKTRFAHLNQIFVKPGEEVEARRVIGTVGATGFIRKKGKDGSHLHFEVYSYNKHINPLTVLPVLT